MFGFLNQPSVVMQPQDPPSEKLVAGATESASAVALQEPDVLSLKGFIPTTSSEESITAVSGTISHTTGSSGFSTFSCEKLVACSTEFASGQVLQDPEDASSKEMHPEGAAKSPSALTLQDSDVSWLDEFLISPSEESTASPCTVPHNKGSSGFSLFSYEKLVARATGFAGGQVPQNPFGASSKEFIDTLLEELITADPQTAPRYTSNGYPQSASSVRSNILIRRPPNCYQVFYIRMDRMGSFWTYPDVGGTFHSIHEADDAIKRFLDELRLRAWCSKEQAELSHVGMIHDCKYFLDGPSKGDPTSPSSKSYEEKRYLIQALLDQYNIDENLFGGLAHELDDLLQKQWFYENNRSYYHFNFTTKQKEGDDSTCNKLFFAEVSHMQGKMAWEVNCCCIVETENKGGLCYGCRNNGNPSTEHPKNTDEYSGGHLDLPSPFIFMSPSSLDDDDVEDDVEDDVDELDEDDVGDDEDDDLEEDLKEYFVEKTRPQTKFDVWVNRILEELEEE